MTEPRCLAADCLRPHCPQCGAHGDRDYEVLDVGNGPEYRPIGPLACPNDCRPPGAAPRPVVVHSSVAELNQTSEVEPEKGGPYTQPVRAVDGRCPVYWDGVHVCLCHGVEGAR